MKDDTFSRLDLKTYACVYMHVNIRMCMHVLHVLWNYCIY